MTSAEKTVLTEIVNELEKVTRVVIALKAESNVHLLVTLTQKYDSLRSKIDALPKE